MHRRALGNGAAVVFLVLSGIVTPQIPPAFGQTAAPNAEALQTEIRKRDALIESLVKRVEKLERQVNGGVLPAARATAKATRGPVTSGAASEPAVMRESTRPEAPAPTVAQSPPAPSPAATPPPAGGTEKPPAPGQFEVSPEAAERALERTLTATGALLVPQGFAEVEPVFAYTRREVPNLVLFDVSQNQLAWALGARIGLPWESQFEISVPYNYVQQKVTDNFVAPPSEASHRNGNSFGDLTVGIAKTLLHETGWLPDLVGRISWEAPTGPQVDNRVPMPGSSQNRLTPSLTAIRRQDPLVFVGTVAYGKAFEQNSLQPGNQLNFGAGVFLATSPETTLRGVLSQSFSQDVKVNDVTFPGSNTVQSVLTFGASSILGRGVLADLQVGIGLTKDSPKYSVILSFPIRFGVPIP